MFFCIWLFLVFNFTQIIIFSFIILYFLKGIFVSAVTIAFSVTFYFSVAFEVVVGNLLQPTMFFQTIGAISKC